MSIGRRRPPGDVIFNSRASKNGGCSRRARPRDGVVDLGALVVARDGSDFGDGRTELIVRCAQEQKATWKVHVLSRPRIPPWKPCSPPIDGRDRLRTLHEYCCAAFTRL